MNRWFGVITLIVLSSCCEVNNENSYKYDGVTIKRIDKCNKTSFYYIGTQNEEAGKIWAEYSGINDGFSGYLVFGVNGKVTLLSGDGYFQTDKIDTSKFDFRMILSYERPELGLGVYYIHNSVSHETEKNKGIHSGVKTDYLIK